MRFAACETERALPHMGLLSQTGLVSKRRQQSQANRAVGEPSKLYLQSVTERVDIADKPCSVTAISLNVLLPDWFWM